MISKRKKKYLKYLESDEWAKIKVDLIELNDGKCERCGSGKKLQVHHLSYDNLYFEEPDDLILLCSKCHMIEHGLIKIRKCKKYYKKSNPVRESNGGFSFYKGKVLQKHNVFDGRSIRTWRQLAKKLHWHETLTFGALFKKKGQAARYVKSVLNHNKGGQNDE